MWRLAKDNLLRERTRLLVSVAGVAFSVVLMLALMGLYNAYEQRIASYFGEVDADLWVVQSGTSNFFHSSSVLPIDDGRGIAALPGVSSVRPYVGRQVALEAGGTELPIYVVGVDRHGIGGPVSVVEGDGDLEAGQIALNRVTASSGDLSIGDRIRLRGRSYEIAALTDGGDMVMYRYAFVTQDDVFALQGARDIVNFFLVDAEAGEDVESLAAGIERAVPGTEAWTPERVVAENKGVIEDAFLPVIGVLVGIGLVVGTAVIGLTTYSGVIERRREYGVVKALGADGWATFRVVLAQSGIAGLGGYAVGVAASLLLAAWLPTAVPQFALEIDPRHLLWVLGGAAGMILASVALPVRRLARIDPAEVFTA